MSEELKLCPHLRVDRDGTGWCLDCGKDLEAVAKGNEIKQLRADFKEQIKFNIKINQECDKLRVENDRLKEQLKELKE